MSLSVADLDLSSLDDEDRWTLEHVIAPMVERDADLSEIASELGVDRKVLKRRRDELAAKLRRKP